MTDGYVRLASIGLRRYTAETEHRDCSSRLLLTSALRLLIEEVGEKQAARLVLAIFETHPKPSQEDAA